MVKETRDVVMATGNGSRNISVGELLQWMHTTGEMGEKTIEASMEDALGTPAAKSVTARTGSGV